MAIPVQGIACSETGEGFIRTKAAAGTDNEDLFSISMLSYEEDEGEDSLP